MHTVKKILLVALLAIMTMGPACDSSDNGGGGATSAGKDYSIADLTGNWTLLEYTKKFPAHVGVLGFSKRGDICLWQFPPNPPIGPPDSGQINVSPDGKITGVVTMVGDVFKFDLQFQPDGSIKGTMYNITRNRVITVYT